MPQVNTNPDRDFSTDYVEREQSLRDLLRRCQVADLDDGVQRRVGELIGRAVFNPAKPFW